MTVRNAKAYLAYARLEEQKAWGHAWPLVDTFRPVFVAALAANAALLATYQSVAQFFGAKSAAARKAVRAGKARAALGLPSRAEKRRQKAAVAAAAAASTAAIASVSSPVPANDSAHTTGGNAPNTPTRVA